MTTQSSSGNKSKTSSPTDSVICEEVFDESSQPSAEEIADYAEILGIDPIKEPHLLYLAKEGLMQPLPKIWKICYSEEKGGHYYYNTKSRISQWDHPLDDVYRDLVKQARLKPVTTAVTPVIDNSDDASQIDSGIRSLQGNDDCDNTNNTNEMTSPVNNVNANTHPKFIANSGATAETGSTGNVGGADCSGGGGAGSKGDVMSGGSNGAGIRAGNGISGGASSGSGSSSSAINYSSTSTSGFSGGVSRFLESRTKDFGLAGGLATFQAVKNSRFEVTKTNPQIGQAIKFGNEISTLPAVTRSSCGGGAVPKRKPNNTEDRGFTLSGNGAMFLKSRKQMETGLHQAECLMTGINATNSTLLEASTANTSGYSKSILRDSSLTDMRKRLAKDETDSGSAAEDKKSVRFNLEEGKLKCSPEDGPNNPRRLTQSPDISVNSDDDDGDNDEPWDDNDDGNDDDDEDYCGNMRGLCPDGSFQISLNPFITDNEKPAVKEIEVIPVPKTQTIKMLKAQSFSMDLPDFEKTSKLSEAGRSQSVEINSAASYLDNLKDNTQVKPLYDDSESESKGSSIRSFIINKTEQETSPKHFQTLSSNPFDLDELDRKHTHDVEKLESKLQSVISEKSAGMRTLKVASKIVSFLKKDSTAIERERASRVDEIEKENKEEIESFKVKKEKEKVELLKAEQERMEEQLQREIDDIKQDHEQKLKNIRHEYELRLTSKQHELDEDIETQLEEYRAQLDEDFETKRKAIVDEHKVRADTLQKNHSEILQDLERDLKSEEEIIKREHTTKLSALRDKMAHELDSERQRMRETGDDRLYEKVRCEKRLLEDKYRCLKEKYVRLKTDVKLSLERRNRRREAQALNQNHHTTTTTTGSETERSISNKPSIGHSDNNHSLSLSTSCQHESAAVSASGTLVACTKGPPTAKPPVPPKTHLTTISVSKEPKRTSNKQTERGPTTAVRKPGITSKYIKHLQMQDTDTTSISQSDTTISNNYAKGHYLPIVSAMSDNGNSDSEAFQYQQHENNNNSRLNNAQRKKLFSRMKSASTSRLNSENYKGTTDRPCTPVENLRHQLQKLEDLEDQFPENAIDTTYHLRYPFSDISNEHPGNSCELEFFKHRIHLERDSVRRAKESLRTQRTNFRARQREIKMRHKSKSASRHSLDQLIQEEKELTEMEVNLHRTRALLGEKVIRLRHLEQSLLRIYEKEKPSMELLGIAEQRDDTTLSDLSSHSSSGFSSTDFASGADTQNVNQRKDTFYNQESSECIQNLEILNAEIREILDILGKNQQHGGFSVTPTLVPPSDLHWSNMMTSNPSLAMNHHQQHQQHIQQQLYQQRSATTMHAPQSIPTLADRLETYRQLANGRMQPSMGGAILTANTIVSQNPRAINYTTSLVERTRDLRNWLRHAKNEHDLLTGMNGMGRDTLNDGNGDGVGNGGKNGTSSVIGSDVGEGMIGVSGGNTGAGGAGNAGFGISANNISGGGTSTNI